MRWNRMIAAVLIPLLACNLLSPAQGEDSADGPADAEEIAQTQDGGSSDDQEEPGESEPWDSGDGSSGLDVSPPAETVKLIFIHHSCGENWLADWSGELGRALRENNYFVSDTNYGWGPEDSLLGGAIGDFTDIGQWWNWFLGPSSGTILGALYAENEQHAEYERLSADPGGENTIVMFKSCFPNSALEGNPGDGPAAGDNPLQGMDCGSGAHTLGNAKRIYVDLLGYFGEHTEKLFIVITAPPLLDADSGQAANARALNTWLVEEWLSAYPHANVAVFDFFNVLTSNGGSPNVNDLGADGGNHHRIRGGTVEYVTDQGGDTAAYAEDGDSHPTPAGNLKATGEFVPLLNYFYHRWRG
jgi:hypothetical protein